MGGRYSMELKIENLSKKFQETTAVDGISYTLHHGVYGLLGINGAGKTTLMRMLCTLIQPTKGKITYNGKDIFEMDGEYRKLLGYLPQEFGFYPDFTVEDYLMYISSIKGLRPAAAKKRIKVLLHQVGLFEVRKRKMKKLSGGMKRRAGIAQAMLNDPKILILDEPTVGLDPNERIRFRNLISELARERLVLLSTHIVSDVEYIADQILLMKNGSLVHAGTPEEIVSSMEACVWNCIVSRREVQEYLHRYKVANVKPVTGYASNETYIRRRRGYVSYEADTQEELETAPHRMNVQEQLETVPHRMDAQKNLEDTAYKMSAREKRHTGDQVVLRILSKERPMPEAVEAEPSLEDAFLYYFGNLPQEEGEYYGLL